MIPKIIHQTWKDSNIPTKAVFCTNSWRSINQDYEYRFWTDKDIFDFVDNFYPQFTSRLNNFEQGIIKADFFRLLVLYHFGGIYADIDFECLKPIKEWELDKNKINIACEPKEHNTAHGKNDFILCNALIISPPKVEFLMKLIDLGNLVNEKSPTEVMHSYGPLAWTKLYKKFDKINCIKIIDSELFYPLPDITNSKLEYTSPSKEEYIKRIKNKEFNSYAVHYWDHSNWNRESILDLLKKWA